MFMTSEISILESIAGPKNTSHQLSNVKSPHKYRDLKSGLIPSHVTRLNPQKFVKLDLIEGLTARE